MDEEKSSETQKPDVDVTSQADGPPTPNGKNNASKAKTQKSSKNKINKKYVDKENNDSKPPATGIVKWWKNLTTYRSISREEKIRNAVIQYLIHIVFLICISIVFIDENNFMKFAMNKAIRKQFTTKQFTHTDGGELTFADITTAEDFWSYLENGLTDFLYSDYWYDKRNPIRKVDIRDRGILHENKLIGVPRIRQLKVRNNSCTIPDSFKRHFYTCYAVYDRANEDERTFGLGTGPSWKYNPIEDHADYYDGTISTYLPGGYYAYLSQNSNESARIVESLKSNFWIDRGTRAVFVDFVVYNANINLFGFVKLIFEFPPTGGVIPKSKFYVVFLLNFTSIYNYAQYGLLIVSKIFIVYYLFIELILIYVLNWWYFKKIWSYFSIVIISLFVAYCYFYYSILNQAIPKIKEALENMDKFTPMFTLLKRTLILNNLSSFLLFLSLIKTFKYLSVSRRLGQLNHTLKKSAMDLLGFTIMFCIVFLAFAMLGYLLFGTHVEAYKSFPTSIFTLLRTILGEFNYLEIERTDALFGPLYFMCYIFFVFFILLNMFLAILIQAYSIIKYEATATKNELQVFEYLRTRIKNCFGKSKCCKSKDTKDKKESENLIEKIKDALQKCNFDEVEIKLFLEKYNLDKKFLTAEEIKQLLLDIESSQVAYTRKELEGKRTNKPLIGMGVDPAEFEAQALRLNNIEENTRLLANKVDSLLKKLDNLDSIRSSRRN